MCTMCTIWRSKDSLQSECRARILSSLRQSTWAPPTVRLVLKKFFITQHLSQTCQPFLDLLDSRFNVMTRYRRFVQRIAPLPNSADRETAFGHSGVESTAAQRHLVCGPRIRWAICLSIRQSADTRGFVRPELCKTHTVPQASPIEARRQDRPCHDGILDRECAFAWHDQENPCIPN